MIYFATVKQLKQLVFWHFSYHPESNFNQSLNIGLVLLCYAVLDPMKGNDSSDCLLLCISCWQRLYLCFPIFRDITQGFLSMALGKDIIRGHKGLAIMVELRRQGQHHDQHSRAPNFVCDFKLAMTTPSLAQVDNMAQKIEGLVLLDEFTTRDMQAQLDEVSI